jgi:hypothetical protein
MFTPANIVGPQSKVLKLKASLATIPLGAILFGVLTLKPLPNLRNSEGTLNRASNLDFQLRKTTGFRVALSKGADAQR